MRYKRTLVTGARGLIGSTISTEYGPSSDELNLMNFDSICDYIKSNEIDSIIHCAAKVGGIGANINRPGEFFYGNIMMNTNLLEAARVCNIGKVVSFMSTCVFPSDAEYPLTPDQINTGEPHTSNYPYAYAKRMVDVMGRAYRKQYGSNFVTVIPCNAYGTRDNYNLESSHVIPAIIHKCYLAKRDGIDLHLWGTGKPYREFIYSEDLGHLSQWVLQNYDDPEPLVLSVDEEINMDVLATEICHRMGFTGKIIYNQQMEGQLRKPSDNSKLKSLLPDFKFTPIEEGLQKSIDWFISNYEECRK